MANNLESFWLWDISPKFEREKGIDYLIEESESWEEIIQKPEVNSKDREYWP
jgi:hypothetical protein